MRTTISNTDDVIDSRDVIDRIEELEGERDSWVDETTDWVNANPDDYAELMALTALQDEAEGYAPDWTYGETLIRDSYFTDYTRELLEDCRYIPHNLPHYIEIDWDATARNIQQDYTSVEFDGVTYWVR